MLIVIHVTIPHDVIVHVPRYTHIPIHQPVVVETPADHNGVERLVMDDLLSQQQCDQLIELASVGCPSNSRNQLAQCPYYSRSFVWLSGITEDFTNANCPTCMSQD